MVEKLRLYHSNSDEGKVGLWEVLQEVSLRFPLLLERPSQYWAPLQEELAQLRRGLCGHNQGSQITLVNLFFANALLLTEAVYDHSYMKHQYLEEIVATSHNLYFLSKLMDFCKKNPDMIRYETITQQLAMALWNKEEWDSLASQRCAMENHQFLRYYLSTAFPPLFSWFLGYYPPCPQWLQGFFQEKSPQDPKGYHEIICHHGVEIGILYHSRCWSYSLGGKPLLSPIFHFEDIMNLENDQFWKLLPLCTCRLGDEILVVRALGQRLSALNKALQWQTVAEKLFLEIAVDYQNPRDYQLRFAQTKFQSGRTVHGVCYYWQVQEVTAETLQKEGESHLILERLQGHSAQVALDIVLKLSPEEMIDLVEEYLSQLEMYPNPQPPQWVEVYQPQKGNSEEETLESLEKMVLDLGVHKIFGGQGGEFFAFFFDGREGACFLQLADNLYCLSPVEGWQIWRGDLPTSLAELGTDWIFPQREGLHWRIRGILGQIACDKVEKRMES